MRLQVQRLGEDYLAAYDACCDELAAEWQPVWAVETHLVHSLADCKWKDDHAKAEKRAVYAKTLTGEPLAPEQLRLLSELQQYSLRYQRRFEQTAKMLQQVQSHRKRMQAIQEKITAPVL